MQFIFTHKNLKLIFQVEILPDPKDRSWLLLGYPGGADGKESACLQETWV